MATTTIYSIPEALALFSTDPSLSLFTLTHFPKEIKVCIAEFLDHQSLVRLGTTCSPLRQLVLNDGNSLWKALHDNHWSSGSRSRFDGPPSQRPRGGIIVVDDDIWQAEFIHRFTLDKSVHELLGRLAAGGSAELRTSRQSLVDSLGGIDDSYHD